MGNRFAALMPNRHAEPYPLRIDETPPSEISSDADALEELDWRHGYIMEICDTANGLISYRLITPFITDRFIVLNIAEFMVKAPPLLGAARPIELWEYEVSRWLDDQ